MGRKKNPENNYFHEGIEEAIQLYNKAESELERNRLFRVIYPAVYKIAEVYYNKVKPTYMEGEIADIIMDCTCYLTERLHLIKPGKGKGFSYLTVCARNYYIFHNQRAYTGTKKTLKLDVIDENWDIAEDTFDRATEMEESAQLLNAFADYLTEHEDKLASAFTRKTKPVIQSVIGLIRNIDNLEDFNRRSIMNNLTEINGMKVDRHYITKIFNKLEVHYGAFKKEWIKTKRPMKFVDKTKLTEEEKQFCITNYKVGDRQLGIIGLSRRFNVEEYEVRKTLNKEGLCSI